MDQLQSIKEGNSNSFRQAYYEHHSRLYRYIYKYTRSHYLAEETVQLSFIKLWEKRDTLSGEHSLQAQLFRIGKSTVIDLLRKEAARTTSTIPEAEPSFLYEYNHAAEQKNEVSHVLSAIETLPAICRKVFKLSRFEGLSHKDIATELSVSPKTVEAHIAKALKHLRNAISSFL
jgi:RNA polymerase sigma-70 factor (ECF subfamily)